MFVLPKTLLLLAKMLAKPVVTSPVIPAVANVAKLSITKPAKTTNWKPNISDGFNLFTESSLSILPAIFPKDLLLLQNKERNIA